MHYYACLNFTKLPKVQISPMLLKLITAVPSIGLGSTIY